MILSMIEALRRWEGHCEECVQCRVYDNAPPHSVSIGGGPCGVGRAIILNLIRILQQGL